MLRPSSLARVAFALCAVAAIVVLLSRTTGWFSRFGWFDEALHAYTSFAVTLVVAAYARGHVFQGMSRYLVWQLSLIAAAGLALGTLWEVAEWVHDRTFAGELIKAKYDTVKDLTADTCGALAGAVIGLWATWDKPRRDE
jgi:hypothetical protein